MKHFYKDIPGFFSFKSIYDECLLKIKDNGVWVEIGSWQGRSIAYAVVESIILNKNINFTVVDIWYLSPKHYNETLKSDNDLYNEFIKNISSIKNKINICKEDSSSSARHFKDNSVDVCMIDANHAYESVLKDINAWYPKIKKGGILIGDDCTKDFPGVEKAIKAFTKERDLSYQIKDGCWILYL